MAQSGKTAVTIAKQAAEVAAANTHKTSTQISGQSGLSASTNSVQAAINAKAAADLASNQQ